METLCRGEAALRVFRDGCGAGERGGHILRACRKRLRGRKTGRGGDLPLRGGGAGSRTARMVEKLFSERGKLIL